MKKLISTAGLLSVLALAAPALAQQGAAAGPDHSKHSTSAQYDNRKWEIMVPELGEASPQISILRVDPKTQATQLLIKMPKAMHVPIHWHSANETHTVIKGTMVFAHEGQQHEFGPGGFNYLPARMHHEAWATDDSLVFITVDSAWDVNWVAGPPTKSDLGKKPIKPTTR